MPDHRVAHAAFERDRALERRRSAVAWVAVSSGVGVVVFAGLAAVTDAGAAAAAASPGSDVGAQSPGAGDASSGDQTDPFAGSLQPPGQLPGRVSFGSRPIAVSGGS